MDRGSKTSSQTEALKVHATEHGPNDPAPMASDAVGPKAVSRDMLLARLADLQSIAKNVALDADLQVKLGTQGGGWSSPIFIESVSFIF